MNPGPSVAPRAGTHAGLVEGIWDGPIAAFRGIPFARPPVGLLRWRTPREPERWEGTRLAHGFGPAPVQPQPARDSLMFRANFDDRQALVMSEDCLYLNVWTPDPSPAAQLPVMVWVHGGGNRFGYGSQDIHDGRHLAERGVVVVTLNYRLGALGFLAHPELSNEDERGCSGNYALLDVIAALRWVQEDIAPFGGDSDRVTIAGNSAGAAIICHLMASPATTGLYHQAIGQSSSGVGRPDGPLSEQDEAHQRGIDFAAALGATDLADLHRRSAVELCIPGHYGPVVDGTTLVADTDSRFERGHQRPIPLLVGSNADEGSVYAKPSDAAAFASFAELAGGNPEYRAAYPGTLDAMVRKWVGDHRFRWPVWRWASLHAASGAPTFHYSFDHSPPIPSAQIAPPSDGLPGYGSFHSAELPYVWDNLQVQPWEWSDRDRELASQIADCWVAFVTSGHPHHPDGRPWSRADATNPAAIPLSPSEDADGSLPATLTLFDNLRAAASR